MVIGDTFAYGHIPKTGGDAVHAWLAQIDGLEVDPINENRKHECFSTRGIRRDIYVLSIRRLPFWALSLLHELAVHPDVARAYSIPPGNTVRPGHALLLKADECLEQYQSFGRPVSIWLRMEHLFDELVHFINEHIQPVTPELRRRLLAVRTKGQRSYNHNVDAFFTPNQIGQLYARFPVWAAIEKQVYGSLYGERGLSGDQSEPRRMAASARSVGHCWQPRMQCTIGRSPIACAILTAIREHFLEAAHRPERIRRRKPVSLASGADNHVFLSPIGNGIAAHPASVRYLPVKLAVSFYRCIAFDSLHCISPARTAPPEMQ